MENGIKQDQKLLEGLTEGAKNKGMKKLEERQKKIERQLEKQRLFSREASDKKRENINHQFRMLRIQQDDNKRLIRELDDISYKMENEANK